MSQQPIIGNIQCVMMYWKHKCLYEYHTYDYYRHLMDPYIPLKLKTYNKEYLKHTPKRIITDGCLLLQNDGNQEQFTRLIKQKLLISHL